MFTKAVDQGVIKGLQVCPGAPKVHHLFFADDSFLFGEASMVECRNFQTLLKIYEQASSQRINLQKSSVAFSKNVAADVQSSLSSILGFTCVKEHERYLGLPIHIGRSKTAVFSYLKERLTKKLVSWRSNVLSSAGKEILIKAVTQAMPQYVMNYYLPPKGLCDDLQQLCAQFFWGDSEDKKKIHWRSWDHMCLTKAEAGMG